MLAIYQHCPAHHSLALVDLRSSLDTHGTETSREIGNWNEEPHEQAW